MKSLDASTQATLDAYRAKTREMILFDLGAEGVFGFWSDVGTLTWNGITFVGAGSLIEITENTGGIGVGASELTVTLRSVPEAGLTPDLLGSIESYSYFNRPFRRYTAFFDPDTSVLLSVVQTFAGYLGPATHTEDGEEVYISVPVTGKSLDHSRTGYRRRSQADQATIDSTDNGFRHAAVAGTQKIFWGVTAPKGAK